jgi:hypothetical protein
MGKERRDEEVKRRDTHNVTSHLEEEKERRDVEVRKVR